MFFQKIYKFRVEIFLARYIWVPGVNSLQDIYVINIVIIPISWKLEPKCISSDHIIGQLSSIIVPYTQIYYSWIWTLFDYGQTYYYSVESIEFESEFYLDWYILKNTYRVVSGFWIDTYLRIQRELYLDWYILKNTERVVSGLIHI